MTASSYADLGCDVGPNLQGSRWWWGREVEGGGGGVVCGRVGAVVGEV